MSKVCEVCSTPLPSDFGNSLCIEHYQALIKEQERVTEQERDIKVQEEKEVVVRRTDPADLKAVAVEQAAEVKDFELQKMYRDARSDGRIRLHGDGEDIPDFKPHSQKADPSIKVENYMENPEAPDKPQVMSNLTYFMKAGVLIDPIQRQMYNHIKNCLIEKTKSHAQFSKHIWKPHVVDVGCGCGVGTNILSQEAEFTWGIDKNELSTLFAKEAFNRDKNGVYYSPQVSFDCLDILVEDRETMKFDFVVAIEIIEHINDYRTFLKQIINLFGKRNRKTGQWEDRREGNYYLGTEWFISSPNRNHPKLGVDGPKNIFHVREWNVAEMKAVLAEYFQEVVVTNFTGKLIDDNATDSPALARCRKPKI